MKSRAWKLLMKEAESDAFICKFLSNIQDTLCYLLFLIVKPSVWGQKLISKLIQLTRSHHIHVSSCSHHTSIIWMVTLQSELRRKQQKSKKEQPKVRLDYQQQQQEEKRKDSIEFWGVFYPSKRFNLHWLVNVRYCEVVCLLMLASGERRTSCFGSSHIFHQTRICSLSVLKLNYCLWKEPSGWAVCHRISPLPVNGAKSMNPV